MMANRTTRIGGSTSSLLAHRQPSNEFGLRDGCRSSRSRRAWRLGRVGGDIAHGHRRLALVGVGRSRWPIAASRRLGTAAKRLEPYKMSAHLPTAIRFYGNRSRETLHSQSDSLRYVSVSNCHTPGMHKPMPRIS